MKKKQKGFTLLEILLVVAAIAILAGIVILAINPIKQLIEVRNTQRISDLNTIDKAITSYQIDNKGLLPVDFPTSLIEICNTGSKISSEVAPGECDGYYDLSYLVPVYLVAIPSDPGLSAFYLDQAYAAGGGAGYQIMINKNRIALVATNEKGGYIFLNITEEEFEEQNPEEEEEEFLCGENLLYQGELYPSVQIGDQCWLGKNLNISNYRNGDPITYAENNWYEWDNLVGKWCYLNNNSENEIFGKLYNWYAITDSRGICPEDWHVPSDSEWTILGSFLTTNPGLKMKSSSLDDPPWDGNNSSGFSALPGGIRWTGGSFSSYGTTYLWSSELIEDPVPTRQLSSWNSNLINQTNGRSEGLSVRCLKD